MPPRKQKTPSEHTAQTQGTLPLAKSTAPHALRIGPAGWSYPDWAGYVYPSRRPKGSHEAAYLAEFFDTI